MTTTDTQAQGKAAAFDAAELESRMPKTGVFNITAIAALTSSVFGGLGYTVGKYLGRIGDEPISVEKRKELGLDLTKHYPGRGEVFGKWVGGGALALIGVSVGMRHAREAKEQATALAARTLELERQNAALASAYTQPVGTLVATDMAPQVEGMRVDHVNPVGRIEDKAIASGIEKN